MKEPVDHILRPKLPWRLDDCALTECGYEASEVKTITREELQARWKDYGEQRTALQVEIDAAVLERVQRGFALLEEQYGPGWQEKIDLSILDLSDGERCVLGQVYDDQAGEWENGYEIGLAELGLCGEDGDGEGVEYGFSSAGEEEGFVRASTWLELTVAWRAVLAGTSNAEA